MKDIRLWKLFFQKVHPQYEIMTVKIYYYKIKSDKIKNIKKYQTITILQSYTSILIFFVLKLALQATQARGLK